MFIDMLSESWEEGPKILLDQLEFLVYYLQATSVKIHD